MTTRIEGTALVLLAAGRSARFVARDSKLDQDLGGIALGLHIARTLAPLPFRARIAVTGRAAIDYRRHGFETVANADPGRGLSRSVALGVERAVAGAADAVLIVLADMPMVTARHVHRLFVADGDVVASFDGTAPKPPALFTRARFADLLDLHEEDGARGLIRNGVQVAVDPAELVDIDTASDLFRVRQAVAEPLGPPGVRARYP